jgi:outer membrane protein assembly factor BamB
MMTRLILVAFLFALGMAVAVTGQQPPATFDWPQWRGPDRSGVSKETGLLAQWPASGPAQAWSATNVGAGYGSLAVSGDRLFVQGLRGRDSGVSALNRADGKLIWSKTLGQTSFDDRGPGPRATPTVDGDRLYVLTESGDLACLRLQDGSVVWQRNILKEFGGRNPPWLVSESPLVDGANVIVTPGGRGAGLAALDKMTGKTVWTSRELHDEAAYSSVIAADVQGVRTLMTLTSGAGVGVRAQDGRLMWRFEPVANNTANIATPVFADNKVFYTTNYGTGAALLSLTAKGGMVSAAPVYTTREMQNHHGGVVLVNGYVYGFNNSILTCLEFATGKMMWRDRSVGKGSLVYADGHLYLLSENGVVGLAEATPAGYREKGRFRISDQGWPAWAHPVVSNGRLYIRNQGVVSAYSLR